MTQLEPAIEVAERLRAAVERVSVTAGEHELVSVTVSIGVVSFVKGAHANADDMLRAADEALYAAKHAGRNTVRTLDERRAA